MNPPDTVLVIGRLAPMETSFEQLSDIFMFDNIRVILLSQIT
jgi:hypothetical protein